MSSWTKIAASHLSYKQGSHGETNVNGNRGIIKNGHSKDNIFHTTLEKLEILRV